MKTLGAAVLATMTFVCVAHAADILPTEKPPPLPPVNCFASVWSFLDSTAADCPLTYAGFTVYATLDAGLMYNTNGAPWNQAFVNGTQGLISKQSNGPKWLWSPNNINQSVIGVKMSEPIAYGWSLVGTLEAGFDPLSGLPVQLATLTSHQQRQSARPAERQRRIRAAPANLITRRGSSASATRPMAH